MPNDKPEVTELDVIAFFESPVWTHLKARVMIRMCKQISENDAAECSERRERYNAGAVNMGNWILQAERWLLPAIENEKSANAPIEEDKE
jgi:hypothetical protein